MFSFVFPLLFLVYYSEADIQISESVMIARRVKSLECSSEVNLSRYPGRMVAYHQWNQVYPGDSDTFSSNLRAVEALNTQYTLELQKFDNNTDIYSSFSVYNASNGLQNVFNLTIHCSGAQRKLISLANDDYYRYRVDHILTYSVSDSVKFNCLKYLHFYANLLDAHIGWINTAGDKIFVYNQTEIRMNLAEIHNKSMLCCLYYNTYDYGNGKHIKRFVKEITLLIYREETPNSRGQPNGTTTKSYIEGESNRNITKTTTQLITEMSSATRKNWNITVETGKTTRTTNETGKSSKTTKEIRQYTGTTYETDKTTGITYETGKNSKTTNEIRQNTGTKNETTQKPNTTSATDKSTGPTSTSDHDADTTDYVIIIISSISATFLFLLIGICAIKKRCWKKTIPQERAQLPLPQIPGARLRPVNELDSNTPFYLNLLFRRECELEIQAQEEPHYEEVIYQ